jgi:hypothetical protein
MKKNIYYAIWVDAIVNYQKNNPEMSNWKFNLFIIQTTCNALNLFTIDILISLLFYKIPLIKIDIFPGTIFNSLTEFIVQYASPFIILNYFLIFYKDRYKKLIEKYPNKNGTLAMTYDICSAIIGFISLMLYGLLG